MYITEKNPFLCYLTVDGVFGLSDEELPNYVSLMVRLLTSGFSAILSSACPVEYGIYSSGVY